MITKDKLKYYDARLAGNPNKYYHEIVNCEVVKPPHSRRLWHTDFFVNKRKWFVPLITWSIKAIQKWGFVSDMISIYANYDDEYKTTYAMWVNNAQTEIVILRLPRKWMWEDCDDFWFVWSLWVAKYPTTPNWYHKFIRTEFVKWVPRQLFRDWISSLASEQISDTWVYINKDFSWLVDGQFRDESLSDTKQFSIWAAVTSWLPVKVWQYLFTYDNTNSFVQWESGVPSQVWVVTWLTDEWYINVRSAWSGMFPEQTEWNNLRYKIFPHRWEVFLVDTSDWLHSFVHNNEDLQPLWYSTSSSYFVSQNNSTITSVNQDWFLVYWWTWTKQFYRGVENSVFVWPDTVASPTFQQYTLVFKSDWLKVVEFAYDDSGDLQYKLNNTDLNIWLFSKHSYDNYRSDFYFLWSNKRLYALSISPTTYWTYATQLKDMSEFIKWDLENIWDNDIVYLQATEQNLKIFIVWDTRDNWLYTKTKILLFNKDYQFRHKWETCSHVIIQKHQGQYYGDNIYNYCWYVDKQVNYETTYTQRIKLFFWENNTIIPDVNLRQQKLITEFMILVGKNSVVNEWSTHIDVDMHTNLAKPKFRISNLNDSCYFKLIDEVRNWTVEAPPKDFLQLVEDNSNYINDCDKSWDSYSNLVPSELCWCPDIEPHIDDYCVCLDDKKYYIAPISKMHISMIWEVWSNMHEITIRSQWNDRLEFGGLMIPYFIKLPTDYDTFFPHIMKGEKCDSDWTICNCASSLNTKECACE